MGLLSMLWLALGHGTGHAAAPPRLCFWRSLPAPLKAYLVDNTKFLIGWTFDAAASKAALHAGDVVDAHSA